MPRSRHFYQEILGLKLTHEALEEWFEYDLGDTTFAMDPDASVRAACSRALTQIFLF